MNRRGVTAVFVAAALALAGCGGGVDESTTRACNLLASAEDGVSDATNAYVASGKSAAGSDQVRSAIRNYPVLISQAANEALSGPPEISSSFQDAVRYSRTYQRAMSEGDVQTAAAASFAIQNTIDKCKAAGVDMPISDVSGG